MTLKNILLALVLMLNTVVAIHVQASTDFTLQRTDKTYINYYLHESIPSSDTLLVLIQGSDCNRVYHNKLINDKFAKVLPQADVLTVEKYGIDKNLAWDKDPERPDCPNAYLINDSPTQRVKDYTQVLNTLNQNRRYSKIVLVGGSEGALIANILASQLSDISATISLNGGGRKFVDDVLHNIRSQSPSDEAYKQASDGFIGFHNYILNSEPFELNMSGHGYNWWKEMFEIDQTQVLSKIATPLLLIQSGQDKNVSVDLAIAQAKQISKTQPNVTFKVYEQLDHSFEAADGTSQVDAVIKSIQHWLTQYL